MIIFSLSEGAKVRYETDFLAVSNGFSYVDANGRGDTASPEVAVSMADGLHANTATLYLRSKSGKREHPPPWTSSAGMRWNW